MNEGTTGTRRIEINFPFEVQLPENWEQRLAELLEEVCRKYEAEHPGEVMWVFGCGCKMLTNPFMTDENHPMQFDCSVLEFDITSRLREEQET